MAATMVTYPYNDPTIDQPQRDYLKKLADFAEDQNLSEDLRPYVRAITIAFTVFAAFVVGLRFTARHLQGARYLKDDYTMLFALVILIGNMIMNLIRKWHWKMRVQRHANIFAKWLMPVLDCIQDALH